MGIIDYHEKNKKAWEYNVYDFWIKECLPSNKAKADKKNPYWTVKEVCMQNILNLLKV